jgi:hypothetical protein
MDFFILKIVACISRKEITIKFSQGVEFCCKGLPKYHLKIIALKDVNKSIVAYQGKKL